MSRASESINVRVGSVLNNVQKETVARSYQAANHLRNASLLVLRGQRSGRRYRVPHTRQTYQASAPGEIPAVRTGMFRLSWRPQIRRAEKQGNTFRVVSAIESGLKVGKWLLGELLEKGTRRMNARPYKQAVKDRAMPQVLATFRRPYKL